MSDFDVLKPLLHAKVGFTVLDLTPSERQIRVLGRLPLDRMGDWLVLVHAFLQHSGAWSVDVSKTYFLREGRVVYGWRLIFQAPDIKNHLQEIQATIQAVKHSSRREVTEVTLPGAPKTRGRRVRDVRGSA